MQFDMLERDLTVSNYTVSVPVKKIPSVYIYAFLWMQHCGQRACQSINDFSFFFSLTDQILPSLLKLDF